ncbi:hypothetical protein QBC34DRAFT_311400 [Podospora aff. communis PSN243]|uniref:Cyclin n=1 Tax=Podospora aff. communis PSN243 TaxID=3040156 RepID=A0AAV9G767_9PEZI|nr:hypothetical protein QBC34DRAFT_311400 [Podospora aff. communis PSN243]
METAFQLPSMASYENLHAHHPAYGPTVALPDRPRPALNERPAPNEQLFNPSLRCPGPAYPQQQQQLSATLPQPRVSIQPPTAGPVGSADSSHYQPRQQEQQPQPAPQRPTRPLTPAVGSGPPPMEVGPRDAAMVLHNMEIPECISPKGGNLADFVADLTALFWFESMKAIEAAEQIRTIPATVHIRRIPETAQATSHFKKWVHTVLTTTQVTQNVVLLALLFIHRLKLADPNIRGRQGSEYRLFTVALMLGNKFLDDNTYTNKTWADVSGISVNEIHVMEVEFLSNMRYSLLVSKEQWGEWLVLLAKLYEFLERAGASPSPLLIPSPSRRSFNSPLPSPTATLQLTPQTMHTYSPNGGSNSQSQGWPTYSQSNAMSPLALKPGSGFLHRKRSFPEDDPTEPPAKRASHILPPQHGLPTSSQPAPPSAHPQPPIQVQVPTQAQRPAALPSSQARPQVASAPDHARLAAPSLSINTSHAVAASSQPYPAVSYAPPQASPLSLPPLVPGVRAMSTVFPPAPATYASPHPVLPLSGGPHPTLQPLSVTTPTTAFPPVSYGTPTKRLSPQNALTPTAPYGSSPVVVDPFHHHAGTPIGNNGGASGMHTPISHSPSVYLQHRNSPYKPVRHVNTLLHPPPSGLQQYHFANALPPTQMHYQPLGRRNELRTGIVPEFAMARAGHQGQMGGAYHGAPQVLPNPTQGWSYQPPMPRPIHTNLSYN